MSVHLIPILVRAKVDFNENNMLNPVFCKKKNINYIEPALVCNMNSSKWFSFYCLKTNTQPCFSCFVHE